MFFNFINFHSIPFHSQNSIIDDYDVVKRFINDNFSKSDEFHIVCLNEVYSYRSGIFGSLFNCLARCFKNQPVCLKNYLNSHCYKNNPFFCNDFDIIASFCSYFNRYIPLLNYGVCDYQNLFFQYDKEESTLHYLYNDSKSTYTSMLDSGCAFLSNKTALYQGFVPFEKHNNYFDKLMNKGIQWSYFENNDNGYLFLTFNLSHNLCQEWKFCEIEQVICLANEIQLKYIDFDFIDNFQCIIIGDFRIELWDVAPILTAYTVHHLYETTYLLSYDKNLHTSRSCVANQTIITIDDHCESKKRKRTESVCLQEDKEIDEEKKEEENGYNYEYKEERKEYEFEGINYYESDMNYQTDYESDYENDYESDYEVQSVEEVCLNPLQNIVEVPDVIVEIKDDLIIDSYFPEEDVDDEWTRI